MAIVTPVFHFNGQCEEAIGLYQKAFGATATTLLRYSDADSRDFNLPLTDIQRNMIYHAELFIGKQRIMLSDIIDSELTKSVSAFLTITYESAEDVEKAYEVLKEGCTIIYPLHSTTYSTCMVSLIDKFGFRWGIMTETI
ncbi:MAG: VOC family protein [Mobilitalea sp.]